MGISMVRQSIVVSPRRLVSRRGNAAERKSRTVNGVWLYLFLVVLAENAGAIIPH